MTEICLNIEDDGTMTVSAGEGGQQAPVQSIEEALGMIKELAAAAAMPTEAQAAPMEGEGAPAEAMPMEGEEESAMMEGYRPGQTGR